LLTQVPDITLAAQGATAGCDRIPETGSLRGCAAVVTGASSGIGRAIAIALSREGAQLCAVGRNPAALAETISAAQEFSEVSSFQVDLTVEGAVQPLLQHLEQIGKLDILVHCAGVMHPSVMERALVEDLDSQYAINVRTPYLLTQRLLPLLTSARGQIVFINSSVGLTAKQADLGQYSATKHALKAVADSLREELNPKGIRVLSVYLGRTATPLQEARFREEAKPYKPELLMQPEDVATMITHALCLPRTAEVTDISMRPMCKSY
jgi:NAD(P)-dependent dehydrogenase (short-subunit alcohol dehydrogenase family)